MKYKVIEKTNRLSFEIEVNISIQEGWKPLGGMSCTGYDYGVIYTQAMIKGDEE